MAERVFLFKDQPRPKHNGGASPATGAKTGLEYKNGHGAKMVDGNKIVIYGEEDDLKRSESMIEYILPATMSKGSCCVIS